MDNPTKPPAAEILQFPKGGKAGLRSAASRQSLAREANAFEYDCVSFGSCWYHDEALSGRDRKHDH